MKSLFYYVYINLTSGLSFMWLLTFLFPTVNPWVYFGSGAGIGIVFSGCYPLMETTLKRS